MTKRSAVQWVRNDTHTTADSDPTVVTDRHFAQNIEPSFHHPSLLPGPKKIKIFFRESRFSRPAHINNCMKMFTVNVATYLLDQDLNRMNHVRADLGLNQGQFVRQALDEFFAAPLPDRMTPVRGPVHKKDNPKFTVALIDDRQNDLLASSTKSLTWSRSKVIRLAILRKLERLATNNAQEQS